MGAGVGNEQITRSENVCVQFCPNYLYDVGCLIFLPGSSFPLCKMRSMEYSIFKDYLLTLFISYLMVNIFLLAFYKVEI